MPESNGHVLIVDDTPMNIDLLTEVLGDTFELSVALNGEDALEVIAAEEPDLILLDVMMPGIDGYEVCRRLKANERFKHIPVVFLTALADVGDEARGLEVGGIDYITKPFTPELVKARVRNQVARVKARSQQLLQKARLEANYQELRRLEEMRDGLVQMIVHDMRSPLMGLSLFLEVMSDTKDFANPETFKETLGSIQQSVSSVTNMVNDLLDVSRLESGNMPLHIEAVDLGQTIESAIENLGALASDRKLQWEPPPDPITLDADAGLVRRVAENLIANALKFCTKDKPITVIAYREREWFTVEVADQGPGIPPEHLERIFDKFGQVEARKEGKSFSSGLGLAFCQLVAIAHGGSLSVLSQVDQGARFFLRLPRRCGSETNPKTDDPVRSQSIDVLIVDPQMANTTAIKTYLESHTNWTISTCLEAETALHTLKSSLPDLLLVSTKLNLPDGEQFLKYASDRFEKSTPKVLGLTTTQALHEGVTNGKTEDEHPLIAKDMPLQHLLERLRENLQE